MLQREPTITHEPADFVPLSLLVEVEAQVNKEIRE